MKKRKASFLSFIAVFLGIAPLGLAQIIENPSKPRAANAGRVIVPEEVLAISDEGTRDYYFKGPRDLTIAPDGSLFLIDEFQVLQFDKDGKFVRNLHKKGQGPGEMSYVRACLTTEKNVIVHTDSPDRLLFFDYAGRYEKEIPMRFLGASKFMPKALLALGAKFYIQSADQPRVEGEPDYVEVPHSILALDAATFESRELSSFPTISYVITGEGGRHTGLYQISSFFAVPYKGKYLALSHTSEYLIKIFDPAADKVIREFRRAYERVKPDPPTALEKIGNIKIGGKRYPRPEQKFQSDVKVILTRGDEIWTVTSTQDKSRGVLIDVFNGDGIFMDSFYLKLPDSALRQLRWSGYCTLDGDFLWVAESDDENDIYTIKKYRLGI
ncbi:MAG: hypothetical protein IH583_02190 [Candidatus Aminicenantes bacterium]|nr:hypothetical protein [Candidatus Aminicenantes bacterium]